MIVDKQKRNEGIILNGQRYKFEKNQATINDLLDGIESNYKKGMVFTRLILDGVDISTLEEESTLKKTISQFKLIEISAKSRIDLAFEAISSCSNYLDNLTDTINSTLDFYQKNDLPNANQKFGEVIEIIDLYIQLVQNIYSSLKDEGLIAVKEKTWQDLEMHLFSVLKSLIPAKEKEDTIMLCDLLEYELKDNLVQWKIKVLPQLKKLEMSKT